MGNINNQLQNISNTELALITNDNGRLVHNPKAIKDINTLAIHYDITAEQISLSNLSKDNKEVLLATLTFPQVSSLDIKKYDSNYVELVGMFGKMIVESGIGTMEAAEQEILITLFVEEITNEFSYLTLEDVRLALKKGVRLDYGKFYGINITTLNFWLKEYINNTKKEAMKSLPSILPKKEYEGLNEEQQKIVYKNWLNSYIDLFEKYHEGENIEISDIGNVFYKYCIKNKIGSLSDSEKITLENKAKRIIISKGKEQATSTFQLKELKQVLDSINKNNYNDDTESKIVAEGKRLAIIIFFDKLIADKLELKDLIYDIEKWKK